MLDAPVTRIAAPDTPVPFSPPLEKRFLPQVEDVVGGPARARRLLTEEDDLMATGTAVDVVMPQMGVSVSEGTITKWLKSEGDPVAADEPLLEISTDKVDTEVPAPASGVLGPDPRARGRDGRRRDAARHDRARRRRASARRRHRAAPPASEAPAEEPAAEAPAELRGATATPEPAPTPSADEQRDAAAGAPSSPPSSRGSRPSTISTSRSSPAPAAAAG